jgi:protein-disulfide isomerase
VRDVSKGARVRAQRQVQVPQNRGKRPPRVPAPPGARGSRLSRRALYAIAASGAVLLALVLVLGSVISSGGGSNPPTGNLPIEAANTTQLLKGIPQHGTVLGDPKAPVTMYEWADVQCPYCAEVSGNVFPDLVRNYVRPGKVKIQFNGVVFRGPDSEKGLRFALAAAQQDKMWNVLHLLYANQGEENSGWVSDELLASVARHVPGFDVKRAFDARNSQRVTNEMDAAARSASDYGIDTTPSFAAAHTGQAPKVFTVSGYDIGAFRPTLDKLVQQGQ